ncbi:hypothetical protein OKW21_000385 [Catalinimonas alkaloidigena]|uniref:hypothetical protein n=1 Tax=Catalinimonas alkaloidigena TaxID=1075417 RepID=UPI002405C4C8|nr:hypothetical protein [Catalinimonas alkaloidigena]MDF9795122.1 hypothetical protein [Catalinimonas alkaloidigena]
MKLNAEHKVLEAAQLALSTMELEESIRLQMEAYGLSPKKKHQGQSLVDKALEYQKKHKVLYDAQWSLSQQLNAQLGTLEAQFKEHAWVARTAFRKQPEVLHALKIKRFANHGWACMRQAAYFYARIEEMELNFQPFGVSKKELEQATASIHQAMQMKEERTRRKGIAESCTQEKKAAFKALRLWVMEFRAIARLTFRDNPQMLEMFSILVPSKV